MTATPTEDWTLFPDDIVRSKHSSIKERRGTRQKSHSNPKICNGKIVWPEMPPTPPGSSPAPKEYERTIERANACTHDTPQSLHHRPTFGPSDPPAVADERTRTHRSYPYRLPTPDISDVDEDEFWACCKDGSKKD
ncbi:MAG: hypothetical protein Q9225_005442 [Loekoesia sp. 1 TL-2023]